MLIATLLILAHGANQQTAPTPNGTRFGRSVVALDDLDGDGVQEMAVGAPNADEGRGVVLVLSGKTQKVVATWRHATLRTTFGHSLRTLQDVDEDGIDDVVVGFEFWDRTEIRSGVDGHLVFAIDQSWKEVIPFGDYDGDGAGDLLLTMGSRWEVRSGRTNEIINGKPLGRTGGRFDPIGDVNGDGLTDGIYFGKTAMAMLTSRTLEEGAVDLRPFDDLRPPTLQDLWPGVLANQEGGELELKRAAPAGDLDGDGSNDFLVVAGNKQQQYVFGLSFEERSKVILRVQRPAADSMFPDEPPLGYATLGGVDLDGDERDDVLVGNPSAWRKSQVIAASGKGETIAKPKEWPAVDNARWHVELPQMASSTGVSMAAFGDADDDGTDDVLVGNSHWFWTGTVDRSGSLRLLSGRTGKAIWVVTEDDYEALGGQ